MTLREVFTAVKDRITASDIATRMASGAFWSFTGTALAKMILMIAGILCARILGKELYGQYGLVKTALNTFMVLGGTGLGITATKYISEYKQNQKEKISSIYFVTNGFAAVMAVLMLLIVFFLADFLAVKILNAPSLAFTLRLSSVILLFIVVNVAQEGVLAGFEDFKGKAIAMSIGSLFQAFMLLTFAKLWGLNGAIMGYGLGFIVIAICYKIFINRNFKVHNISLDYKKVKFKDFKLLYKFALPAALSSMLVAPTYFVLRIMIKRYVDFAGMADYDVGEQWRLLILFIPTSICSIVLPILSSIGKGDKNRFWRVMNINLTLNGVISVFVALIVISLSGFIVSLYGKDFNNPVPLIIFAISCVFTSMSAVLGNSIVSIGRIWESCLINLIWVIVVLGLAFVFLENGYGTSGVTMAILISYIELLVVQYIYLRTVHKD